MRWSVRGAARVGGTVSIESEVGCWTRITFQVPMSEELPPCGKG